MKATFFFAGTCALLLSSLLHAQSPLPPTVNQNQQLAFAGLRSVASQGQFNAVQADSAGNLYLLLDQGDGLRLLKTDNAASSILAQALLGSTGDIGIALTLDASGNVFVAGTSSSTTLTGTPGAAIPNRTDTSTNSFVAKFDSNLNPLFVTFTGGSRIAASAIAVSGDAVFVTGSIFSANLPVTSNGIQQNPAQGSFQNGFVEKFSADGSSLLYATYLTGAMGNTVPAAIAVDSSDDAFVGGFTTSSGFPTIAALVPSILSNPSGFLTRLTPAGDAITFSTFVPGDGLTSVALDPTGQTLLFSGTVNPGQFPLDTVFAPIAAMPYQSLLKMPVDGSSVQSGTLLAPGTQSFAKPASAGAVWVGGLLSTPLLPGPALHTFGYAFALRLNSANQVDQIARFGGLPNANSGFASVPTNILALALDPAGEALVAGSVQPTASSSLLATETYDLPLFNNPTDVLPSTLRSSEANASACNGSMCFGSAAFLAKLNPNASAPSLAFSADDAPFLILRNLGSAQATSLQLSATGASLSTNCGTSLAPGAECDLLLSGSGPAMVTASAANASPQSISVPSFTAPASTIMFSPRELDFGIQSSASRAGTRTLTVSNLGSTTQTFTSVALIAPRTTSPFTEAASDCTQAGTITTKVLPPGSICHITLGLTAFSTPASDGPLQGLWQIGTRAVVLSGFSQAAALTTSAAEIDFGTQFKAGLRLPRFLYLSNASTTPVAHAALSLPASSPFTLTDGCPSSIAAQSVCRIRIDYVSPTIPSRDSVTLSLDHGLSVLVTGQSLPQPGVGGSTVNPNLSVTPNTLPFPNAVPVTGLSSSSQNISITNSGNSPFSLSLSLTGDFTDVTSCGGTLAGGQTCAVTVTFVPSQPGTRQGLLSITAGTGFSPAYVQLSGSGAAILAANNGSLDFGSITVGEPVVQFFRITQPFTSFTAAVTGPYSVVLVQDLGFGPGQPASTAYTLSATAACPNCFLGVRFVPTAPGAQPGTLTLSSTPNGTPYTLGLTGVGLPATGLILSPLLQSFGSVPVNGSSAPILFALTNLDSDGRAVTLNPPSLSGDFALNSTPTGGQGCSGSLAFGASCLTEVNFAPSATGARAGSLNLSTSNGSVSATLSGFGLPDAGLAINPIALVFNNVPGAQSLQQTVTLTNTGSGSLQIASPSVTTPAFTPSSTCATLAPAASCTMEVTFQPGSSAAVDTLSIPVVNSLGNGSSSSTTYTVALSGTYTSASAGLQIVPGQADFGPVPTGTLGSIRQFTVGNLTTAPLALSIVFPRQFALLGAPCATLAAGATCNFTMQFTPVTGGSITGSLYLAGVSSTGAPTLNGIGYMQGFGVPPAGALTISGPGGSGQSGSGGTQAVLLNFGTVASGQTVSQTLTLANLNPTGSPSVTVRRISINPPFLSTSNCGGALPSGQSCTVHVSYSPINQVPTGTVAPQNIANNGVLTIESDASSSPDLIDLGGQAAPVVAANPMAGNAISTFTLSESSLTFAATSVGNPSPPQIVTVANTGTAPIHILSTSVPPDFTVQTGCSTLLTNSSCTLSITSTPQTSGTHLGSLEILSDSSDSLEFISLLSTAIPNALTIQPASLNFGSVVVGARNALTVTITNSSAATIVLGTISATGDYAPGGSCPAAGTALPAGGSCTINVSFSPAQVGSRIGTLSVASSASATPLTVALIGTGSQSRLTATPAALAFGTIVSGAASNLSLTLNNSGSAPVTGLSLNVTGDYAVTLSCPSSSLAPGQSCTVQVTFSPTQLGSRSGTLTVTSSDPSSPLIIPLTGSGVSNGSFILTVNGAPSASVSVASGTPAGYTLAVTPSGGYTGSVALTCAAIIAGPSASCSLQPSTLQLSGGAPQLATVTINTVTSASGSARLELPVGPAINCLLLPALLVGWKTRRRLRAELRSARLSVLLSFALTALALFAAGCGGGSGTSNLRYTPAGTYQYQVTATSTSGVQVTQSVTLNLTVQ